MKHIKVLVFLLLPIFCFSQENKPSHSITYSIGQGFEDGLIYYPSFTLGIGYEYQLNKWFGIQARIHSYFRGSDDINRFKSFPNTSVGFIFPGSASPFMSDEDLAKFTNQGLKDRQVLYRYKALTVPITLGIKFTPLRIHNFQINIFVGPALIFDNSNDHLEFLSGLADVQLSNGEVISEELILYSDTHFRSLTFSESIGLGLEYVGTDYALELFFGENATLLGNPNVKNTWDLSLKLKLSL